MSIEDIFDVVGYNPKKQAGFMGYELLKKGDCVSCEYAKFEQPIFRGLEPEIDAAIKYLGEKGIKEDKIPTYIDGIFEIRPAEAEDLLENFPNLKMLAFYCDYREFFIMAVYSASGFDYVTDELYVGEFDPKADWQWFYDFYPDEEILPGKDRYIQTGDEYETGYRFIFKVNWNTVDYVFERNGKKLLALKEYVPPKPVPANLEYFRKVISDNFKEFDTEENVSSANFAPDYKKACDNAEFILRKNSEINAVICIKSSETDDTEEFANIKTACELVKIPYVELHETKDKNEKNSVAKINSALFEKKFKEYIIDGKEKGNWIKAASGGNMINFKVKFSDNRTTVCKGNDFLKAGDIVKTDGIRAGQPGMIIETDVDGYYGSLKNVTEYIAE